VVCHSFVLCFSISCALNAKSPSWDTAITRRRGWPTAKPTTTSCLAICVTFATRSSQEMVSTVASPRIFAMWPLVDHLGASGQGFHRSGKSGKVSKKEWPRKSGEMASKSVKIPSLTWIFLKTVLWLWSRRRIDRHRYWNSQTLFGARRVVRRKIDRIWSGKVGEKVRKFQE